MHTSTMLQFREGADHLIPGAGYCLPVIPKCSMPHSRGAIQAPLRLAIGYPATPDAQKGNMNVQPNNVLMSGQITRHRAKPEIKQKKSLGTLAAAQCHTRGMNRIRRKIEAHTLRLSRHPFHAKVRTKRLIPDKINGARWHDPVRWSMAPSHRQGWQTLSCSAGICCREAPGFIRNLKPSSRMQRETERASSDPIHSGPHDPAISPLRKFVKNRNQRFYTTLMRF